MGEDWFRKWFFIFALPIHWKGVVLLFVMAVTMVTLAGLSIFLDRTHPALSEAFGYLFVLSGFTGWGIIYWKRAR